MDNTQPKSNSFWDRNKKKILLIVLLVLLIGGIIISALFGTNVLGEKPKKIPGIPKDSNGMAMVTLVDNIGNSYLVPIIFSNDNAKNEKKPTHWLSFGKKMGITPIFDSNTYKLKFDQNVISYVQAISFAIGTISNPILLPTTTTPTAQTYNFLPIGNLKENILCIYTIGKGICNEVDKYEKVRENGNLAEKLLEISQKVLGGLCGSIDCTTSFPMDFGS